MIGVVSVLQWLDGMALMVAILGGIIGAAWALYQLGQKVNAYMRRQDKVNELISREFNGHTGSLKSQSTEMASDLKRVRAELDLASRERRFLQHTVDLHIADVILHAVDPEAHKRDDDSPDDGPAGPRE